MNRKIVLAYPHRDYVARLAAYLRETEPSWEIAAFTHAAAFRLRLQDAAGIDVLLADPEWLRQEAPLPAGVGNAAAWVEEPGGSGGEWLEVPLYQPLPGTAAGIRGLLASAETMVGNGCRLLTVFSASGGAGKTVMALNLVRQAGERGLRALYLNLEALNATYRIFGKGEPDSLSRLMYALQAEPDAFAAGLERAVRHHAFLRADIVDAPEHPGERAAMTPELLESLLGRLRESGRYDLIVADPDSGVSAWHAKLLERSDRVAWLVSDDWQSRGKTERLLAWWKDEWPVLARRVSFIRCGTRSASAPRWPFAAPPDAELPFIPQWMGNDDPGRIFGAAGYAGVLDALLDGWGWRTPNGKGVRAHGAVGKLRT